MQSLVNLFLVVDEETGMVKYFESAMGVVIFAICICAILSAFYVIKSAVTNTK